MYRSRIIRLILVFLPTFLFVFVVPALAQTGSATPRRLTFDGLSTPLSWDADGLRFTRPGAVVRDGGGEHIANELWRVDPFGGNAQQLAADFALSARPSSASSTFARVFIVDDGSLQPELWLAAPDGSNARRLLKGEGEYFGAPVLSPDGKHFAFTRMPTGSETHAFNSIWLGDVNNASVKQLIVEASSPVWSPDGRELAFEHRGDIYIGDWRSEVGSWKEENPKSQIPNPNQPSVLTPPATIRVQHVQGNADFSNVSTCRPPTLTVGSIMTIPFELYVSYVVPIEASASNPPEKLRAQAVASRTYAWQRVNPANPFDVSDWTDTQAMCDLRADPRSDAATNATAGQYIACQGALITALYGADGGDPTRACPFGGGCAYLQAVDDPVSFKRARNGHGGGMSQNGATFWAQLYGWNYIQILTHYYSGITIEGPTNFGALSAPWQNWYVNTNRARIVGNASHGNKLSIFASGQGLNNTLVASNTLLTSLDLAPLPDQPLGAFVVSGNLSNTQISTLTLGIDRVPPTGTLALPPFSLVPTVTAQLSATEIGPSGFAGYGLSNNWIWEGESQYVLGAGTVVSDALALNGSALFASAGASGIWYGPYTHALPLGQAYRAYFRLKTSDNNTSGEVATLDVVPDATTPIGIRRIYGTDFRAANAYQEFAVDFNYVASTTTGIEFRVTLGGAADQWLDRILIATYPVTTPLTTSWVVPLAAGTPSVVIAKFSDNAGNVSEDVTRTVSLSNSNTTPPLVAITSPVTASLTFSVTWSGQDAGSGIGSYDVQSRDVVTVTWQDWFTNTLTTTATFVGLPSHTYQFRVRARDRAGNLSAYSDSANATTTVVFTPTQFIYLPITAKP